MGFSGWCGKDDDVSWMVCFDVFWMLSPGMEMCEKESNPFPYRHPRNPTSSLVVALGAIFKRALYEEIVGDGIAVHVDQLP